MKEALFDNIIEHWFAEVRGSNMGASDLTHTLCQALVANSLKGLDEQMFVQGDIANILGVNRTLVTRAQAAVKAGLADDTPAVRTSRGRKRRRDALTPFSLKL